VHPNDYCFFQLQLYSAIIRFPKNFAFFIFQHFVKYFAYLLIMGTKDTINNLVNHVKLQQLQRPAQFYFVPLLLS